MLAFQPASSMAEFHLNFLVELHLKLQGAFHLNILLEEFHLDTPAELHLDP